MHSSRPGSGSPRGTRVSSRTGNGPPPSPPSGDQDDKSRMNREVHVRICGSRRVQSPPATRPSSVRRRLRECACGELTALLPPWLHAGNPQRTVDALSAQSTPWTHARHRGRTLDTLDASATSADAPDASAVPAASFECAPTSSSVRPWRVHGPSTAAAKPGVPRTPVNQRGVPGYSRYRRCVANPMGDKSIARLKLSLKGGQLGYQLPPQ